jgi:hypothetical protein
MSKLHICQTGRAPVYNLFARWLEIEMLGSVKDRRLKIGVEDLGSKHTAGMSCVEVHDSI